MQFDREECIPSHNETELHWSIYVRANGGCLWFNELLNIQSLYLMHITHTIDPSNPIYIEQMKINSDDDSQIECEKNPQLIIKFNKRTQFD